MVSRIVVRLIRYDAVGQEVATWLDEDCGGSRELARAAVYALRHKISARPAVGNPGVDEEFRSAELSALALVERRLEEKLEREGSLKALERAGVEEVDPPDELLRDGPGTRAFRVGDLRVLFSPARPTSDETTPYISVEHPDRYPTLEEILLVAAAVLGEESRPELWAWIPASRAQASGSPWVVGLYVRR